MARMWGRLWSNKSRSYMVLAVYEPLFRAYGPWASKLQPDWNVIRRVLVGQMLVRHTRRRVTKMMGLSPQSRSLNLAEKSHPILIIEIHTIPMLLTRMYICILAGEKSGAMEDLRTSFINMLWRSSSGWQRTESWYMSAGRLIIGSL